MIEVEVSEGEIRAVDVEKNEVTIQVDGWGPTATAPRLDRRVDKAISGETSGLEFPMSAITIESLNDREWTAISDDIGEYILPSTGHVIQLEANLGMYVATSDKCRVLRPRYDGPVFIEFENPSSVTLGFRSKVSRPRSTVTVPKTLDGVASALRYLSSAIDADSPDKSYPSLRAHPPLIEFGNNVDIPENIYRKSSFSNIVFTLPEKIDPILVSAPLIYYLKADIKLRQTDFVEIESPALSEPIQLPNSSNLERDIAELLHRSFYLDCLVRNAGPYGEELKELGLVDKLSLDIESLYNASTGERLQAYKDLDYTQVRQELPRWHLSTVVRPTINHARVLPHLLDRMSLIQKPNPVSVSPEELLSKTIDDCATWMIRRGDTRNRRKLVKNKHSLARMMGWVAEGIPLDAFRIPYDAFDNRFKYHGHEDGPRSVLVVFNDNDLLEERTAVERIYKERAEELAIDVTVEESLDREQFADRLHKRVDFLHYVGHVDESGFRCTDGSISATELDETMVQTFFLNACSSYDEGLALVERGSVAGAVTLQDVLDPQATKVGTVFARLVMHGYDISVALDVARKFSIGNLLYTVVGDGTHRLMQGSSNSPGLNKLSIIMGERKGLSLETQSLALTEAGAITQPLKNVDVMFTLMGNASMFDIGAEELLETWEYIQEPVFFENEYHWSTQLRDIIEQRLEADGYIAET